jgi:secreted trypsin-like serine protease
MVDSGGGMMLADSNGRYSVIGITSFGVKCAEADFPGVYLHQGERVSAMDQPKPELKL